jgi:glutamate-5-semialdehyde dehydrogenase
MMKAAAVTQTDFSDLLQRMGAQARAAYAALAQSSGEARTKALRNCAAKLRAESAAILKANAKDVAQGEGRISKAMIDRLTLNPQRLEGIATALEEVAKQPDPIGRVLEEWTRPNGLKFQRVSVPLGVIGMIYESRPNVTAEAFSICFRAGNAIILRCGSDCFESSAAIAKVLQEAIAETGLPKECIQLVPTTDRDAVGAMLRLSGVIDVIVPRGGRELIERVEKESRIPLLRQYEGVCHIYIDAEADAKKAVAVTHNAKMRRTSICGAAECVLFDRKAGAGTAAQVVKDLLDSNCEVRGDKEVQALDPRVKPAASTDWGHEFLDAVMAARMVDGVDGALEHIQRYGSHHTDSIITENKQTAEKFCRNVDSAIVMVNASTQFADGGEFGFGGEVGISTGSLHARGPIGAAQLTSYKYIVLGNGQTRA